MTLLSRPLSRDQTYTVPVPTLRHHAPPPRRLRSYLTTLVNIGTRANLWGRLSASIKATDQCRGLGAGCREGCTIKPTNQTQQLEPAWHSAQSYSTKLYAAVLEQTTALHDFGLLFSAPPFYVLLRALRVFGLRLGTHRSLQIGCWTDLGQC